MKSVNSGDSSGLGFAGLEMRELHLTWITFWLNFPLVFWAFVSLGQGLQRGPVGLREFRRGSG